MSSKNTPEIEVKVKSAYLEEQSDPANEHFVFAYTINIRNLGEQTAQLLRRHWIITDANGNVQEVEGAGVIGKQPFLKPGEEFEYTSGVMLTTPVGSMQGSYLLQTSSGEHFNAAIPAFNLSVPHLLH